MKNVKTWLHNVWEKIEIWITVDTILGLILFIATALAIWHVVLSQDARAAAETAFYLPDSTYINESYSQVSSRLPIELEDSDSTCSLYSYALTADSILILNTYYSHTGHIIFTKENKVAGALYNGLKGISLYTVWEIFQQQYPEASAVEYTEDRRTIYLPAYDIYLIAIENDYITHTDVVLIYVTRDFVKNTQN